MCRPCPCLLARLAKVNSEMYQKNSVKYQSKKTWNNLQQTLDIDLLQENRVSTKKPISEYFFDSY